VIELLGFVGNLRLLESVQIRFAQSLNRHRHAAIKPPRVVVESIEAYSTFIDKHVISLSAVRSINSSVGLGVLKRTTALPLPGARRLPHARRRAKRV
jgi:hypothetical protein